MIIVMISLTIMISDIIMMINQTYYPCIKSFEFSKLLCINFNYNDIATNI